MCRAIFFDALAAQATGQGMSRLPPMLLPASFKQIRSVSLTMTDNNNDSREGITDLAVLHDASFKTGIEQSAGVIVPAAAVPVTR